MKQSTKTPFFEKEDGVFVLIVIEGLLVLFRRSLLQRIFSGE